MAKFEFLRGYSSDGDGWDGLYVDGQLVTEAHTVRTEEFVEILRKHGVDVRYNFFESKDDSYFEASGNHHFKSFEQVQPYLDKNK